MKALKTYACEILKKAIDKMRKLMYNNSCVIKGATIEYW